MNWYRLCFRPRGFNILDVFNVAISSTALAYGNWFIGIVIAVVFGLVSHWGQHQPETYR